MTRGRYRWGRKAKLTAGASLAIALRESHKPDSLRDIAFLLEELPTSLSRAFSSVVTLLQLPLSSADPAQHFPTLQSHLHSLIHPPQGPSTLPAPLIPLLTSIDLQTVIRTATSLSTLLTRLGTSLPINSLSTPPTACALFILCFESELRTSLANLGDFANLLAGRFGVSKGVVMGRYKVIEDLVEEWVREVPWLDQFETNAVEGKKRGKHGRPKLSKRVVVAKGLKDVVQFQEEIWRKKLEGLEKPTVELEVDDEEGDWESSTTSSTRSQTRSLDNSHPMHKKQKTRHAVDKASLFLLDPLSASNSSLTLSPPPPGSNAAPPLPLTTYLLTASPSSLSSSVLPTRLQLLSVERGSNEICDDELFEEGELEALIRNKDEAEELKAVLSWDTDEEVEEKGKKKHKDKSKAAGGTSRVNMEALRRALGGTPEDIDEVSKDREADPFAELVEVEDWRPVSPDHGFGGYDENRYEEEC
jgi:transcription factor IIIB subunit 2